MNTEDVLPDEDEERSWRDRLAAVFRAGTTLLETRMAILREELSQKSAFAVRGLAAIAVAAGLAVGTLLLLAALLAAVFARLFHSVPLGILAAMVLYGGGAGIAGWLGWKALSQVRPLVFSATSEELSRDWEALASSLSSEPEPEESPARAFEERGAEIEDLEARVREGAE